jgi:hypothetical protein
MRTHALKHANLRVPSVWLWPLCVGLLLPLACKDESPCDENQDSIGTGCFAHEDEPADGGSGGVDGPMAGAASSDAGAPSGNPDATFGTPCTLDDDSECGGPAPVCATDPLYYCIQIDCLEGEANEGACPEGWTCYKQEGSPSACVNLNAI